jgi:hypothetical protein
MTVTPSAAGNNPPPQGAGFATKKKKPVFAIVSVLALIVVIVGVVWVWKIMHPGPPLPTAPTPKLVDWVTNQERFKATEFGRQKELLGALDNREEEIEQMFRSHKLTEPQMGMAREAAWLGKQMGRMEKFFSLPPGQQRLDYIKKVVDKMDDVDEPPKTKGPNDEKLPKRDKKWGKTVIAIFPADVQAQWKEYQKAINDEQDRRKKERKAAEKAGAATKPATNASKASGG